MNKSFLALLLFCVVAFAQQPSPPTKSAPPSNGNTKLNSDLPTVSFTFDNAQLDPPHFVLSVDQSGNASYSSRGPANPDDSEPDHLDKSFTVSPATRDRIFALAKTLKFFVGDFDFKKHAIAYSGDRTLTFTNKTESHTTHFRWSENPQITELSTIFEGIASTVDAGSKLRYLHRFDRLGLNAYLASMEKQAKSGWYKDLHVINDVLQEIANDPSVMAIARQRAQNIMGLGGNHP